MSLFKALAFLGLIIYCICGQKLLVDKIRWDFLELENKLWDFEKNKLDTLEMSMRDARQYLAQNYFNFNENVTKMVEKLDFTYAIAPYGIWTNKLRSIYGNLMKIRELYAKFTEYQNQSLLRTKAENWDIFDLIENNTTDLIMNYLHQKVYIDDNIWDLQMKMYKHAQTMQEWLYHLYGIVALHDLQTYIMKQFVYIRKHFRVRGTKYLDISAAARKSYIERVLTMSESLNEKKHVDLIFGHIPTNYTLGYNYDVFTRLLMPHFANELDISEDRQCKKECHEFKTTIDYGCDNSTGLECINLPKCDGILYDCEFVGETGTVCLSESNEKSFEYASFRGLSMGDITQHCSNKINIQTMSYKAEYCDNCLCFCDDEGRHSDKFINLRPVKADSKSNSVITGLRLKKHNRMIHLQIQEGQLMPYGYIDQETLNWVPLPDFKITDPDIEKDIDYYRVNYNARLMALDDLETAERDCIITGVRFNVNHGYIHLGIYVSPFHWDTGLIDYDKEFYIHKEKEGRTDKYIETGRLEPLNYKGWWNYHWGDDSYIEFGYSNLQQEGAQNTLPYFDTVPVEPKPAVPLSGACLIFREPEMPSHGGFIRLGLNPYDYSQLTTNADEMPPMKYRSNSEEVEYL